LAFACQRDEFNVVVGRCSFNFQTFINKYLVLIICSSQTTGGRGGGVVGPVVLGHSPPEATSSAPASADLLTRTPDKWHNDSTNLDFCTTFGEAFLLSPLIEMVRTVSLCRWVGLGSQVFQNMNQFALTIKKTKVIHRVQSSSFGT